MWDLKNKSLLIMKGSSSEIPVKKAKERFVWQTPVLMPYENGSMIELKKEGHKGVYKVIDGLVTVIFKTITCDRGDNESIRRVKEEFTVSVKAHEAASDGVVTPISFSEMEDTDFPHHIIELVYEYGGEDLITALKDADGQKIMDVMGSVARTMAKLEKNKIFHSDIKPGNIVISNGVVKLVDFGEAMYFSSESKMFTTKALRGGTIPYLPPEVVKNLKGEPRSVDVYCWGITLYSLLADLTFDQLNDDVELRRTDYNGFLDKVSKLKVKKDTNGTLRKKAIKILLEALRFDPKKRPSFKELLDMIEDLEFYKNKTNNMNEELNKVIKERGKIAYNSR